MRTIIFFYEMVIRTKIYRVHVVHGQYRVEECALIGHSRSIPLLSHTVYIYTCRLFF